MLVMFIMAMIVALFITEELDIMHTQLIRECEEADKTKIRNCKVVTSINIARFLHNSTERSQIIRSANTTLS